MACDPDSLGSLESGQMKTLSDLCDAPIHAQIVERSNALPSGEAFASVACRVIAADGNA